MTDPKVKRALLDLVDAMRVLTTLVENINQRLYAVEDRIYVFDKHHRDAVNRTLNDGRW